MQVYAKVVYAGLCDFGFYSNLKQKKWFMQVKEKWFMQVYPKKWFMQVYAKVVYAAFCDFGFLL